MVVVEAGLGSCPLHNRNQKQILVRLKKKKAEYIKLYNENGRRVPASMLEHDGAEDGGGGLRCHPSRRHLITALLYRLHVPHHVAFTILKFYYLHKTRYFL